MSDESIPWSEAEDAEVAAFDAHAGALVAEYRVARAAALAGDPAAGLRALALAEELCRLGEGLIAEIRGELN